MAVENIFIAGMEKCGTTALSEWMVTSGLAEDRVPGQKEPFLYANDQPHPPRLRTSDLPLLDASVGYAAVPHVVERLPEYDTRIVLCLRNQFERTWSSYKMKKIMSKRLVEGTITDDAMAYLKSFQTGEGTGRTPSDPDRAEPHRIVRKFFPRRSHHIVERYERQEMTFVHTHSFMERIEYELAFYLSRRTLPFVSILAGSFFYFPLRNLLDKYQPSDVSVVTVEKLAEAEHRRRFVAGVFEKDIETSEVPFVFTSAEVAIDEARPDFDDKAFDLLRASFRYDLSEARGLIAKTRFGDSLLDNAALDRYLEPR